MAKHVLIAGTSESGKSTLGFMLSESYVDEGVKSIVLDELMDSRWMSQGKASYMTDDQARFLSAYWAGRGLAAFMDESQETVGRYNKAMKKTATRGRHWGHINHYLIQNPVELDPTVRKQCGEIYLFNCDAKTASFLANEFNQAELEKAPELAQGEYIHAVRFGTDRRPYYDRGSVF